jgi:transcriptional regulator with XRE-family HTH domain
MGTKRPRRAKHADRELLGRTIRALRTSKGMTLNQVASTASVSISLLSQVERGLTDPSLDSLRDIAEALDTTPFRLLANGTERPLVVREGSGHRLSLPDTDIEYQLLSPNLDGPFEVGRWTIEPGGSGARHPRGHPGEEASFILGGRVRLEIGDETIELGAGDFVTFDARIPHRVTVIGDEPASAIFVISPPSF